MLKNNHSHYLQTDIHTRIFFSTNFKLSEYDNTRPLLVFNYGLVCSNYHWMYQLPFFEERNFQILIHDYRCHFNSTTSDGLDSCTFENMTRDLHFVLESFGARNIHMLGHSMGVNVTLEYAKLHPEYLKSIVVISGTVIPPQDIMFDSNIVDIVSPYIKTTADQFSSLFEQIWKNSYKNPIARRAILNGGFNPKKTNDEFVQIYMKKIGELPSDLFFHLLDHMKEHDIIAHLESIKTPTLIIGGDKDKVIPNYLQKILYHYLENSELYIVKDGSHVPQVDFPESINERIERFID